MKPVETKRDFWARCLSVAGSVSLSSHNLPAFSATFSPTFSPIVPLQNNSSLGEMFGEMSKASLTASLMSPVNRAPLISVADEDSCGIIPLSQREGNDGLSSQTVKCNGLGGCMGPKTGDKEGHDVATCNLQETRSSKFVSQCNGSGLNHKNSPRKYSGNGRVENMPRIQSRDANDGSCPKEYALASSTEASSGVPLPPFEFHVSSEQGINLCVDLNSSLLEWIKSLKSEVNICEDVRSNKSQSLQQELGRFKDGDGEMNSSALRNVDAGQIKNVQVPEENDDLGINHPNGGDGCLMSSELPCDGAVNVSEHLEDENDAKNLIVSDADTRPNDEYTTIPDSNTNNSPKVKSVHNSPANSLSGGPCVTSLEQPGPELCDTICESLVLPNSVSLVDASAIIPICSASGSMEIQLSEVASYHASSSPCKSGGLQEVVDPKHIERGKGGIGNSSDLDHNTSGINFPTLSVEKETSKNINRMDNSECSQFNNSFESNTVRSDDFGSHEELSKKRLRTDGEDQSDCSQPDVKSRKHHAGELLRRRSMRLVTK